ncbi:hypothetical protein E4T66_19085 [Sinimarinibacterium sp. CAU 1509]|uniref:WD40/YVTN/BNR-like repeat-containing protein n=1 Tax=Sinimarinibacterium sp. CAU 1509 TaxID=2562283 RepID=UPI0010AD6E68|nr:YCF48-related protein [Sinimarinibacterium sp. CAU 1509]TJY56667.1 hypothetical protein E4T66_19085 [Sinimarinibacterium sp. CAU 1509]
MTQKHERSRVCRIGAATLGVVSVLFGTLVWAQDDEVGIDTTLEPRPAVIAPRSESSLLLDITRAGDHYVVVGQRGNILLSADGTQWKQVPVPNDATLTRVRFVDANTGWAIGYDGTVLGTTDGGEHWTLLQHDAAWGKPYYDIHFFDASTGLLAGANGVLKRSSDGGMSWQDIDTDALEDGPNLYNLITLGDGSLLLAGERGFLALSGDRGETWQRLKSPYTGSFFGALPINPSGAVIFGLRGNAFYAADLAQAAILTPEDVEAMREAAFDPEAATGAANPVSTVAGWTELASDSFESLFGGTLTADGTVLLFGMNGHVMQADLTQAKLSRLPLDANANTDINMNAGLVAGDSLIVVGTSGVQRLHWSH